MKRIGVGVTVVGDVVCDDDGGQRPVVRLDGNPPLAVLRGLAWNLARHRAVGLRHPPQVMLDHLERVVGIDVPDNHQGGILRNVVRLVELPYILNRGRFEIPHRPDSRVLVRVLGERVVVDDLGQQPERLVLVAPPALFLDDLPLGIQRTLIDPKGGHPVGLEPQHQREIL